MLFQTCLVEHKKNVGNQTVLVPIVQPKINKKILIFS